MPAVKKPQSVINSVTNARKVGRTAWKPSYMDKLTAYRMHKEGKTDQEITNYFCISYMTYFRNKVMLESFYRRMESRNVQKSRQGRPKGSMLDNNPLLKDDVLRAFAIAGYNITQVSKIIGCHHGTLSEWLSRHPSLKDIFVYGKEMADVEVINALKKRACGTKVKKTQFATFQGMISDSEIYEEEILPDTQAATIWLVNRAGWKRDNEASRTENKGAILETMEKLTAISEDECKQFDSSMSGN